MENNAVQLLASLLDVDRRCSARELAAEIGVCHKTVLHLLGYRKLVARWIPHDISEGATMTPLCRHIGFVGQVQKGR